MEKIHPCILAGGSGKRLQPLSRRDRPKFLLTLGRKQSLLAETYARVLGENFFLPSIITNAECQQPIADIFPSLPKRQMMLEPTPRNTAASIAAFTLRVLATHGDGDILVLPSDHVIDDPAHFHQAIERAQPVLEKDYVVVFGVRPEAPYTGYGYIEKGEALSDHSMRVKQFTEKPDQEKADAYFASGDFFWNAGIFLFRASAMRALFARHAPDILTHVAAALAAAKDLPSDDYLRLGAAFSNCADLSFDYALMEKAERVALVPVEMGWNDIGSWQALAVEVKKSMRRARQEIVERPWGSYYIFDREAGICAKLILVNPGEMLSLQYHRHRAEDWVVVAGCARVICEDRLSDLSANETIHIPVGARHRLANRADEVLVLVEVQSGELLSEDDIVRLEDKYQRVKN